MKLTYSLLVLLTIGLVIAVLVRRAPLIADSASAPDRGPVKMVRFVLSDDGIYPRRLRVDQGWINVVFEDKTDRSQGLKLEALLGDQRTVVTKISRNLNNRRGRSLLMLAPGQYRVSDASLPGFTAELTVSP